MDDLVVELDHQYRVQVRVRGQVRFTAQATGGPGHWTVPGLPGAYNQVRQLLIAVAAAAVREGFGT